MTTFTTTIVIKTRIGGSEITAREVPISIENLISSERALNDLRWELVEQYEGTSVFESILVWMEIAGIPVKDSDLTVALVDKIRRPQRNQRKRADRFLSDFFADELARLQRHCATHVTGATIH